jgi:phage terminase small subunit
LSATAKGVNRSHTLLTATDGTAMPRTSFAALSIANFRAEPERLEPPAELSGVARDIFIATVNGTDAKHFQPSDLPMLVTYCETAALLREATRKLGKRLTIKGRANPLVAVHATLARTLVNLSIRLRLTPKARAVNTPTRPARVSAYESMPVEHSYDGGPIKW